MASPQGTTITVCDATAAEWNAFVESEDQLLKSVHMEWNDGKILIVEFPSPEHASYCAEFNKNFLHDDIVNAHLKGYLASFVRAPQPRLEPDASYGPLAGPLPAGLLNYRSWHTLKVESGFSRKWGYSPGQLDWKANQWATFVSVRYVLCIALWADLVRAEYKLYSVQGLNVALPPQSPTAVAAPKTVVVFDSCVLLVLQPADAVPPGSLTHLLSTCTISRWQLDAVGIDWHSSKGSHPIQEITVCQQKYSSLSRHSSLPSPVIQIAIIQHLWWFGSKTVAKR